MKDLLLVMPTYRLKDIAETIKEYRTNMHTYGHDLSMIVFDDTPQEKHDQEVSILDGTGVFMVGPKEKSRFIQSLVEQAGSAHESLIRRLLRPSYGGNRNFTVLYSLGYGFISVDDDMRPHGLFSKNQEPLEKNEVLKGKYVDKKDPNKEIEEQPFDVISALTSVLGKTIAEVGSDTYLVGSSLVDSQTDLYTNKTVGTLEPNTVSLLEGDVSLGVKILHAQTFRTGSADVDAVDYVSDFLKNPYHTFVNDMSLRYVLQAFRPVITSTNWRLDCGISAYDNTEGLPPFFPTKLRFEDYGFRLFLQKQGIASAHVPAVQTHYRNPYMRMSLANDLWNEEMANYLKPLLKEELVEINPLNLTFRGQIPVSEDDSRMIMERGLATFERTLARASEIIQKKRKKELTPESMSNYLIGFARDLYNEYASFDPKQFHEHMSRVVKEEVSLISQTMELWPVLVETARSIHQEGLPMRRL